MAKKMLTDDQLSLMTTAVDAELNDPEAQALGRLLESSAEARVLFARLRADRDRLQALPRVASPRGLQQRVMARVATLTPPFIAAPARRVEPTPSTPLTRRNRSWAPIAIAAALLIGVSGSSFWYFAHDDNVGTARNPNRSPSGTKRASDPDWAKWLPADGRSPAAPMPSEKNGQARIDTPQPGDPRVASQDIAIAPLPKPVAGDSLGFPPLPDTRFDMLQARVPFLKPLGDFEREDVRQLMVDVLARDPAYRIDLFARNLTRGIDSFKVAAKAEGLLLHLDTNTEKLVKRGQVAAVAIYTDSLTAAELADLFAKLNVEDAKVSPHVFDVLHATPAVRSDDIDLRNLLGIDPGLFKRTVPDRRDRIPEAGKSITDGTADQIVKSITAGKGRSGVLLAWSPLQARTLPANSAELKAFLSKRSERKPSAVPVVIVIRLGNG